MIAIANQKLEEDKSEMKLQFVSWIIDTHVSENKRLPLPSDEIVKDRRKFRKWYTRAVKMNLHPDKFKHDYDKETLMHELSIIANKVLSVLNG